MSKIKCQYIRKGRRLHSAETGAIVEEFKSVNQCKHRSWELQGRGKELGFGLVRIEE